jgi:hypothetical protein
MRKRARVLLTTVTAAMMLFASAGAAMAHSEATGNPCPAGLETAHGAVQEETAHHNIPCA